MRRAALELLARREYSGAELRERLLKKLGKELPIDHEIERLVAEGLLDDARFAEAFVRMHRRRGHGPHRILHELNQRGIAEELAEAAVDPRSPEWIELARAWRVRRFGSALPRAAADWQRQARHLQARGFSAEQVRRVMREPVVD